MPKTIGQSTYYDFKELRRMAQGLAAGGARVKHSPQIIKGRLVRYELRVTNNGASVVANVELPGGQIAERSIIL